MEFWKCKKCGRCCKNQKQLELYKNEIDYFPKNKIIPYMGIGDTKKDIEIILYKLISRRCPLYDDETGCTIYENRPDVCKRFPFIHGSIDAACASCPKHGKKVLVSPKDAAMGNSGTNIYEEFSNGYMTSKIWLYKKFKWKHQTKDRLFKFIK